MQNIPQPPPNNCEANQAYHYYTSPDRRKTILALGFKQKTLIAWQLTWTKLFPYLGIILLLTVVSACCSAIIATLCEINIAFSLLFIPLDIATLLFSLGILASILHYLDGKETRIRAQTLFEPFKRWISLLPIGAIYVCFCIPENLHQLEVFESNIYYLILFFITLSWFFLAYFYFFMADCQTATTKQIFVAPFLLLTRQPKIWLQAVLTYILVYVALFLLVVLMFLAVSCVAPNMDLIACYLYQDLSTVDLAGSLLVLFFLLILFILLLVSSIYTMFVFAIAYRQSIIACGGYN